MNVKTHPLMEIIASKLFGINTVPTIERSRMIVRACKAAAEYHNKEMQKKDDIIVQLTVSRELEKGLN